MADLLMGNVDADVAADALKAFLPRYGFPVFDAVERVHGTGARLAVVVKFSGLSADAFT